MNSRNIAASLWTASFWAAFVVLTPSTETMRLKLPANVTVPAVLVFGDSIADTGNNNDNVRSLARANFPPYGQDFPGRIPTGRFSNGKVPSDIIVEAVGIKDTLPPYADRNLKPEDLLTGVCFAVGGVGYDPLTSKLASVPPVTDQLDKLKEYIGKLHTIVGVERTKFIIANSLVFAILSTNDIANTYFSGIRALKYDISSYCDFMVKGASEFFKALYSLGVRRLAVVGAPPIGCVPSQRTLVGGLQRDFCYEKENEAAKLFNSKLSAEIDRLSKLFSDAKIIYADIYYPLLDIIQYPTKYGFKISKKGCCGSGLIEAGALCNKFDVTCKDESNYVFWDAYHPTENGYRVLLKQVLTKWINKLLVQS